MTKEKSREARLRRIAKQYNMRIVKSRTRYTHAHDWGQYAIVDNETNGVVVGWNYDADLDDIEEYFKEGD